MMGLDHVWHISVGLIILGEQLLNQEVALTWHPAQMVVVAFQS